jgi:iron complex outermembrane recepter protein
MSKYRPMTFWLRLVWVRAASASLVLLSLIAPPAVGQEVVSDDVTVNTQYAGIEEITVSARKREENLQEVPISVTALSGYELDAQHISDAQQIQFDVPNFLYGKTNFTGQNLQIRGIGSAVVSASGDPAVGIHLNTVPISTRLFEQEFYDVDRIEVLRGPQGTIFGRSSSAGAFNIWTKKPTDIQEGYLDLEGANYHSIKLKGAYNIPVTDRFRLRFAGMYHDRDGFIENLATNTDVDDRHLWGLRGSAQLDLTDDTTIDLMVSYFEEDDKRARIGKNLCEKDTRPFPTNTGCTNERPGFESLASYSTLGGLIESLWLRDLGQVAVAPVIGFAPPPLYPIGVDAAANSVNPPDYRVHNSRTNPLYQVDEFQATLDISHQLDDLTLSWVSGYSDTSVLSQQEYAGGQPALPWDQTPIPGVGASPTQVWAQVAGLATQVGADGNTEICFPGFGCTSRSFSQDRSNADSKVAFSEMRVVSDYDSKLNFTAGINYYWAEGSGDYFVFFSGAELLGRISGFDPSSYAFDAQTDPARTKSVAVFGEAYYDLTEYTKLTLGARFTHDDKYSRSRTVFLQATANIPDYDEQSNSWNSGTGRAVIDHNFNFDFADQSMGYVSISRGSKPGGFNPPSNTPGVVDTFLPESIWAYEVGTKNRFLDNRLQANLSVFFYDYEDYQISKIVNRTSVNENIDAFVWGLEAEFLYQFTDQFQLDFSLAYLGTEIQDGASLDTADPTAGNPDYTTVKDWALGPGAAGNQVTNCGLPQGTDPATGCDFTTPPVGAIFDPGSAVYPANNVYDPQYWELGFDKNLSGNKLPNSPAVQINLGAQYTFELPGGSDFTTRISYYWQSEMYGRIFNSERDKIDSWSQINMIGRYAHGSGRFYVDLWVRNLANNDDITGHYFTADTSGLFTNAFLLEPRTFGVTLGVNF